MPWTRNTPQARRPGAVRGCEVVQPMQMTLTDAGGRTIYLPPEIALDDERQANVVPGTTIPGKPGRWEYPHLVRREPKVLRASGTIEALTREEADHMAMKLRSQLLGRGLMQLKRDVDDERYVTVRCVDVSHNYHRGRFRGRLASFSIQFEADDPFWYASTLTTFNADIYGLDTPAHILEVFNEGEEAVAPLIRITGKGSGTLNPRLTNMTTGRTLRYEGELQEGEILVLETAESTAVKLESNIAHSGTAQGGSSNGIVLSSAASGDDGAYVGLPISLTGGTGAGQTRSIIGYNGTTKTAIVDSDWETTPDATTTYEIMRLSTTQHFWLYEGQVAGFSSAANEINAMNDDYILHGFPLAPGANLIEVFGDTEYVTIEIIFRARWG